MAAGRDPESRLGLGFADAGRAKEARVAQMPGGATQRANHIPKRDFGYDWITGSTVRV